MAAEGPPLLIRRPQYLFSWTDPFSSALWWTTGGVLVSGGVMMYLLEGTVNDHDFGEPDVRTRMRVYYGYESAGDECTL